MSSASLSDNDVVIVSAARTPMGGFQGDFTTLTAPQLGSVAIAGALQRAGLGPDQVDEVLMGNVLNAGVKQAPARQAALGAGLPNAVPCTTVSKVCGSGMKAVMLAHDQIRAGSCEVVVAGGMESMTQAPYLLDKARGGLRLGHGEIKDHMFTDGLEDAYTGRAMGTYAQQTADEKGYTREQMDAYAIESLSRANRAIAEGYFKAEIAPVTVKSRGGEHIVEHDEQPGKANLDKIPQLKPAFAKDGTITPANSSSISDGAAALVLMTAARARALGLAPMAKIVAHSSHAQLPGEFTVAPIGSIQKLLQKTGWSLADVDLIEINEAFAMVTMLAIDGLSLDPAKVNVNGGACALGHPIGSSGARILVTLLHALRRLGKHKGVASLCIGGGEATAVAVEMLPQ
ncbi:MAG: acetyl-CoA C-acyltransferase [Gammaproteobacteria bacterium]|nr:acetyl-CoA C-acyltransferase [Gammaproteobacteria bacterium]